MAYDFGTRLKELRSKYHMSQEKTASRLEISRSTIASYENNTAYPSADVLIRMALLFHVSTDYLLGLEKRPVVVLDGLTKRHASVVSSILDILLSEFRMYKR